MTAKLTLFDPYSVDDQAFLLAAHEPTGYAWQKGFDPSSNHGKLLRGIGVEFYRFEVLADLLSKEMDINQANQLLIEWEKSVGLPDSCFSTNVSIEQRRLQIEQKFSNFGGVQTAADYIRVAAVFGYTIEIRTSNTVTEFALPFPIGFSLSTKTATHTIYIILKDVTASGTSYPLPFPIPFSSGGKTFLQCIFTKLAPANVDVIIVNEGDIP